MAVFEMMEPSADLTQLAIYNSNVGGQLKLSNTFSAPADVHYAVVGLVLADAATVGDIPGLVTSLEALAEITSVNGDQIFGQAPASVPAGFEPKLFVEALVKSDIGSGGDTFDHIGRRSESTPIPLGKKWVVVNLRVPSALTAAAIVTLEAAIEGITGVTTAEHLVDGSIDSETSGNAVLTITTHIRLESTA